MPRSKMRAAIREQTLTVGTEQLLGRKIAAELKALSDFNQHLSLPEELFFEFLRERLEGSALRKAARHHIDRET